MHANCGGEAGCRNYARPVCSPATGKELIRRRRHPDDRRSVVIELTAMLQRMLTSMATASPTSDSCCAKTTSRAR